MNRPDDSPKNSILIYTTEDGLTKIDTNIGVQGVQTR